MAYEIVPCLYDTYKDLQARLQGTICRYENEPVYVHVTSDKVIELYDTTKIGKGVMSSMTEELKPLRKIKPNDPAFDISSPEIGYVNVDFEVEKSLPQCVRYLSPEDTGCQVVHIERSPSRQWKQGLSSETVTFRGVSGNELVRLRVPVNVIFTCHGVRDAIRGTYPPLPAAVAKINRLRDSVAHKEIAVSKDVALKKTDSDIIQVYIKTKNIGFILPDERVIHVKKGENSWVTKRVLEKLKIVVE